MPHNAVFRQQPDKTPIQKTGQNRAALHRLRFQFGPSHGRIAVVFQLKWYTVCKHCIRRVHSKHRFLFSPVPGCLTGRLKPMPKRTGMSKKFSVSPAIIAAVLLRASSGHSSACFLYSLCGSPSYHAPITTTARVDAPIDPSRAARRKKVISPRRMKF